MGFVGSLFGGSYKPERAKTINVATAEQAKQLYGQTQEGLAQQQAFLNALAQQGGIANQSNVFNQLQNVAAGTGPNPALAALQQATGQNIAAQNALMAGQRGGARNIGLLARQAGMQGGALQQQAAGQGATLQAQQQLGALGQLGGLANQQVAQQQAALAGLNQFGLAGQQNILNALTQQNQQKIEEQNAINKARAEQAKAGSQFLGSLIGTAGSLALAPFTGGASLAAGPIMSGAQVPGFGGPSGAGGFYAQGGEVKKPQYADGGLAGMQPQSYIGQYFQNPNQMLGAINQSDNLRDSQLDYSTLADGGAVNRDGMYAKGGMAPMSLMDKGGKVPGQAVVAGDSVKNDIVDAKLSPGEIVIPRSIVNHPNAPEMAAKFVRDTLAKGNFKNKKGYQDAGGVAGKDEENVSDTINFDPALLAKFQQEPIDVKVTEEPKKKTTQITTDVNPFTGESNAPVAVAQKIKQPVNLDQVSPVARGYEAQKQAFMESGRLAELEAKEQEAQYQDNLNLLEAQQAKYNNEVLEVNNELDKMRADILQSKIDPQRFISNMSTGNKIGTAIGLILGGIGAGLTGGENVVLKQLNNYIEQDLFAQKAELGKKENLLSALTQKYGNVNQAMQAARIMLADSISLQMKRVASKYAGRLEAQRLNAEIGKLDLSVADQIDTFAKQRMYASDSGAIPLETDPYRAERIDIDKKPYYAESEAEAKEAREKLLAAKNAERAVLEMQKLRKDFGILEGAKKIGLGITTGGLYDTDFEQASKKLKEKLKANLGRVLYNKPELSKAERQDIDKLLPDVHKFSDFDKSIDFVNQIIKQNRMDIEQGLYRSPSFKKSKESKEVKSPLKKPKELEE